MDFSQWCRLCAGSYADMTQIVLVLGAACPLGQPKQSPRGLNKVRHPILILFLPFSWATQ